MKNFTCLITGASAGIGKATATELAKLGGTIVLACRNQERGSAAGREISDISGNPSVHSLVCDFESQRSIRDFAATFGKQFAELHILINNAGAVFPRRELTIDGIEKTFAVNHLGYFLLTNLLLDLLKASVPSRIINVTSEMHKYVRLRVDNLESTTKYSPVRAYARSKLANIFFTMELARRLSGTGVTVNCVHPGGIRTKIYHTTLLHTLYAKLFAWTLKPVSKGAEPIVYLASSPAVEGITGEYFREMKRGQPSDQARDPELARQVWEYSERLIKS